MESDSIRDRFERRRIFPANSSTRKRREAEGSDPVCVCVHVRPSIPLNWRERGSDSGASR